MFDRPITLSPLESFVPEAGSLQGSLSRRTALLATIGLLGVPEGAAVANPIVGPAVAYWPGAVFGVPERFMAVETWTEVAWDGLPEPRPEGARHQSGFGWIRVRAATRAEALADDPTPEPEPVSVEVKRYGDSTVTFRTWAPGAHEHARHCGCTLAGPSEDRPGFIVCARLDRAAAAS